MSSGFGKKMICFCKRKFLTTSDNCACLCQRPGKSRVFGAWMAKVVQSLSKCLQVGPGPLQEVTDLIAGNGSVNDEIEQDRKIRSGCPKALLRRRQFIGVAGKAIGQVG